MAGNKKKKDDDKYRGMYLPIAIGVGICLSSGFGLGAAQGHPGQGVPFGILLGVLFGAWMALRK